MAHPSLVEPTNNACERALQAYADRAVIRQDGRIVAEHQRAFRRGATICDPWHYVPVLARKPGALRNSAPFKDWVLPGDGADPPQARRLG